MICTAPIKFRLPRLLAMCCGLLFAGCAELSISRLSEPAPPPSFGSCIARTRADTMTIPVELETPGRDMLCTVTSVDMLGNPSPAGVFPGGEIISREFRRFANDNFSKPSETEPATALLKIVILGATSHFKSGNAESTVHVLARLAKPDGGETGWSWEFMATESSSWTDRSVVPPSFYEAVKSVMKNFIEEWGRGRASVVLRGLASSPITRPGSRGPQVKGPELIAMEWKDGNDKGEFFGRCVVQCNDWEGFRAKSWAAAQISEECRRKLDGIDMERVRIAYDKAIFDRKAKTWDMSFVAFARRPYAYKFDSHSREGFITGDMKLMGMDFTTAAEELKRIVLEEMGSHDGPVSIRIRKGEALVRFGDVSMDGDLLTVKFRLVL